MWFVYILKCRNGNLYTGITDNLERRFQEHARGKGGHFTKSFGAEKILYSEKCFDKSSALKREAQIKSWTRREKLALIEGKLNQENIMGSKICSTRKTDIRKTGEVRFGVVGVGGMGMGHCRSLQKVDNAKLTAVCDVNFAAAEKAAQDLGVEAFDDHRKLIRSGLCDVALIATPHPFHPQSAIDCMNAGLHVLSEKPLSERVSTAEKMIRAARKNRVAFAVMFQRRFEPAVVKAIELIRGGRIGDIYRTILISPEFRSQRYYDSGTWRATWSGEGGGVMMNQSPHVIDLFIQLAGMPREVFGMIAARMHRIEVEDQAEAILRYPNGGIGYLYCSTIEAGPGQMIEIFGDKGKLIWRDGKLSFYRFQPSIRKAIKRASMWGGIEAVEEKLDLEQKSADHACVMTNLVRHLLHGEKLITSGESGIASLELANAITLSSFEKRWVKIPISRRRYDKLLNSLRRNSRFFKGKVREERTTDPQHIA